ncbi:TIGR03986 family type III CRISPR-associated RAMP protein [Helicobacter pullorum]|uniref:TIGR03986 family type III CRISPR-associated RAMP protein n=1 Tax=Helicobacter pullorum TaxID=35818 RepID=UPI0008168921|nr:TIGR03986 family CRISPR-associated RAMP protein [Helicobacter pullorum]OCR15838.1 CRISPR-associated RAMP family protein [Helicobacter pullorum]
MENKGIFGKTYKGPRREKGVEKTIEITAQAPYRFISLPKEIFYPDFGGFKGEDICFDKPISENPKSGVIEIKVKAKSKIFIGDFEGKNEDSNRARKFFSHNGKFYIPGSSFKGMIKNIVRILSHSRLEIENKTLAYRDLHNPTYQEKAMDSNKIYMGWLYAKGKKWFIRDVGKAKDGSNRIRYFSKQGSDKKSLADIFDENLARDIKNCAKAYEKYDILEKANKSLHTSLGVLVFTGNVGRKTAEFLFPAINPETKNKEDSKYQIELTQEQIKAFKDAYYIGLPNENENWKKRWSKILKQGKEVPVFFQKDEKDGIKHFGLSWLYKLPYENSILDILHRQIPNYQENKLDMIQRIFGFCADSKKSAGDSDSALKGRVSFSHFEITEGATNAVEMPQTIILSEPRATFYPFYLQQNRESSKLLTYDDKEARLSGIKFYPPRKAIMNKPFSNGNSNIETKITPLKENVEFVGKMRYFNLRKEELGLLVLALTFLKEENGEFYKIGGAKPYGYGDCVLEIGGLSNEEQRECIESFVECFKNSQGIDPRESEGARDLKEFSRKLNRENNYMELKDFGDIKGDLSKTNKRRNGKEQKNRHQSCNYSENVSMNSLGEYFKNR